MCAFSQIFILKRHRRTPCLSSTCYALKIKEKELFTLVPHITTTRTATVGVNSQQTNSGDIHDDDGDDDQVPFLVECDIYIEKKINA